MTKPATILLLLTRVDCNDGVASYLESLITGLRDVGDQVVIVSGDVTTLYGSEQRRERIRAATLAWVEIRGLRAARPQPAHIKQITALIERYGVDVVSPQGFAVLPLAFVVGRLTSRPLVANFHLLPTIRPRLKLLQHLSYRIVTTVFGADRYIAMSTETANFFRTACGISARRIHKQLMGVDTDFYRAPSDAERQAARSHLELDPDSLVTVLPARMNTSKGHDIAAAAFRLVRQRRPASRPVCLFAGAGDQRDAIEADVLRDDADRATFRFLGFVDRTRLRDAYWASDIVLLPSRIEGFGLVVAEAMCCGAIVIRTPSGGWQDQVIEGETGFMVPFDDPAALATAIEKVLDAPDRATMRANAIQVASTSFARAAMIAGTSALYREEAARTRARRGRISSAQSS